MCQFHFNDGIGFLGGICGGKKTSVLVARVVARPNNSLIPFRLANTSLSPVTLHKGAKIAIAELIHVTMITVSVLR